MKVSIVINVLNSHEVVRRHIEYFKSMNLPEDVEIIFVDDGSSPPLSFPNCGLKNLSILYTNDKRPWTQGLARNLGAKMAKGEFLLMTDVDHIFTKEIIEAVHAFTGDRMVFIRLYGFLDENGRIIDDAESLIKFGLAPGRLRTRRGKSAGMHGNSFAIRKSIFWEIGGYPENRCIGMMHQGRRRGEDTYFNGSYATAVVLGKCKPPELGPSMYMFPIGRFRTDGSTNPQGLFHNLSYEQVVQPMLP